MIHLQAHRLQPWAVDNKVRRKHRISEDRGSAGDSETKRMGQALKAAFWRLLKILDFALGWFLVGLAALLLVPTFLAAQLAEKLEGTILGETSKVKEGCFEG